MEVCECKVYLSSGVWYHQQKGRRH